MKFIQDLLNIEYIKIITPIILATILSMFMLGALDIVTHMLMK